MPDEEEFSVGEDVTLVQIRCMNGEGATDEMYGRTFEVPMREGADLVFMVDAMVKAAENSHKE
jgi:hypothetical protein